MSTVVSSRDELKQQIQHLLAEDLLAVNALLERQFRNPNMFVQDVATRLDEVINWGRKYALWPMPYGTACCAIEFMGVVSSRFDVSRFGAELVRFSPRQADLLLVMGTITQKMAPVLKQIYDQMPDPKWVVSMGACASSGGFYDNYSVVQGIDELVPVDVYVAGCPPRPENVIGAIVKIQEKISNESIRNWR